MHMPTAIALVKLDGFSNTFCVKLKRTAAEFSEM
jgi:hypothetical protein